MSSAPRAGDRIPFCARGHHAERIGQMIAHGDQSVGEENEGDRLHVGVVALGALGDCRRHEGSPVLRIEPRRQFDLAHVLACGQIEPGQALYKFLLLARRLEEVDPDGSPQGRGVCLDAGKGSARGVIGADHVAFPVAVCVLAIVQTMTGVRGAEAGHALPFRSWPQF